MVVREFDDIRIKTALNDSLKRYRPTLLRSLPPSDNLLIQTPNLGSSVEIVFPVAIKAGNSLCALAAAFYRMMRNVNRDNDKAVYALDAFASTANNILVLIGLFSQQGIEVCYEISSNLTDMIDRCKKVRNSDDDEDLLDECELDVAEMGKVLGFIRDDVMTRLSAVAVDMVYRRDGTFCEPLGFLSFLSDAFDIMVTRVVNF